MTSHIDDQPSDNYTSDNYKPRQLSSDEKECFTLIKKIVSDKTFWHGEGKNTWSLSSNTKTPTQVKKLQSATAPTTVAEFNEILQPIWKRDRSDDGDRSDATKQFYAAIDKIKNANPSWDEIKQDLNNVLQLTSNREVKQVPKPRSSGSDEGL